MPVDSVRPRSRLFLGDRGTIRFCESSPTTFIGAEELNVHLGTAFFEHRRQAKRLFDARIVNHHELEGPRTRTLTAHLEKADLRKHLKRSRTYPGVLPLFQLDHIYFDPSLKLEKLRLHRRRTALVASDHLPLVADFRFED